MGTENARLVSWEKGESRFKVGGREWMVVFSGRGTSSANGAVRGGIFGDESGNTNVISAMCCVPCDSVNHVRNLLA